MQDKIYEEIIHNITVIHEYEIILKAKQKEHKVLEHININDTHD